MILRSRLFTVKEVKFVYLDEKITVPIYFAIFPLKNNENPGMRGRA